MKRYLLLGFLLLNAALWATPFTVIEMTDTDIVLQYDAPDWTLESSASRKGQSIAVKGALALAEEGKPEVPYFAETIGLPVNGSFTVRVSDLRQETHSGVELRPGVTMIPTENEVEYVVQRDQRAYRLDALYPATLVQQTDPAFMGDHRFAGVHFHPFRYNAARRELTVVTSAKLHIHITGDTNPTPDWEATAAMLREPQGLFLNDEHSRKWRRRPQPTTNAMQTRNSFVQELQIVVNEDGIYKVTYEMLADSIVVWEDSTDYTMAWNIRQIDPRHFELYDENGEVPIHCEGEADGSFDPGDFIEFYGVRHAGDECYYDEYTTENVYRLRVTDHPGARMAVENGGLEVNDPSQYTVPRAFEQNVHYEVQRSKARLGEYHYAPREDIWFWGIISAPSMEIVEFDLQHPYQSTIRGFDAEVMLMGSTHLELGVPDHHAEVRLNSTIIGNKEWTGQNEQVFDNEDFIPNSQLEHGLNRLYISLPGDVPTGLDQVLLDYLDLTYWREYKTDEDFIEFQKPSHRPNGLFQFELENFSSSDVSVYKIGASVLENLQLEPFSEMGGAPWKVTFQDYINSNDVTYYAVTESAKKQPRRIQMDIPSELKTIDHQANYIIITGQKFIGCEGLEAYTQTWNELGQEFLGRNVDIEVVAVEDIFDEFSNGIRDAQAIRDFLAFAYDNWNYGGSTGRVEYVLLLGDGLIDERDDSPWKQGSVIPNKYLWTNRFGATAADNWYVAVVGSDLVGDISIGRINVWEEEQILVVANKLRHYIENPDAESLWHGNLTFAAGGKASDDEDIFAQQSESIREASVPEGLNVTRVYTVAQTVPLEFQGNTFTLQDQFASGTSYIQFMGHGGGQIWADYNLFNYDNIDALTNDKYPLIVSLACYCSQYDAYGASSISEAIVLADEKGAIGHIGLSGLGYETQDKAFSLYLCEALFEKNIRTIGDAVSFTKAMMSAEVGGVAGYALTQGCIYTGDPLVRIHLPDGEAEVTLDDYSVQEGDVLQIHAEFPTDVTTAMVRVMDEKDVEQNTPYPAPVTGGVLNQTYVVPNSTETTFERKIKVFAASDDKEYVGFTKCVVGRTAVMHVGTVPAVPEDDDAVSVVADFYYDSGIDSVLCKWQTSTDLEGVTRMAYDDHEQTFVSQEQIPACHAGALVSWKFLLFPTNEPSDSTEYYSYYVAGPDMDIITAKLGEGGPEPTIDVLVQNVGVTVSPEFEISLYMSDNSGDRPVLVASEYQQPLESMEQAWYTLPAPVVSGYTQLIFVVNEDRDFTESSYDDNLWTSHFNLNLTELGPDNSQLTSLQDNVICEFPVVSLPTGTIAYIDQVGNKTPVHQPSIEPIILANTSGGSSVAYEIALLDSTVYADSTGLLPGGASMRLSFFYDAPDTLDGAWGDEEDFGVYRWNEEYQKWIYLGGQVSLEERKVVKDVHRCGVYTIYRNQDDVIPNIDANVEEQEFSYGGYVSGKGTISFILTDDNGIDVIDNPPVIYLDGVETPRNEMHLSASLGQLINTPIKYQLDLDKGDYTLIISCSDVNGNYAEKHIPFTVNTEFGVLNLANYPNPVKGVTIEPVNEGRTRFTYVLTDDADEVNLKIYTVSGRLVKTFNNMPASVGYHEYPRTVYGWDCRDDEGHYLANGVYFYRLTAKRGGKEVQKTEKMAILR